MLPFLTPVCRRPLPSVPSVLLGLKVWVDQPERDAAAVVHVAGAARGRPAPRTRSAERPRSATRNRTAAAAVSTAASPRPVEVGQLFYWTPPLSPS